MSKIKEKLNAIYMYFYLRWYERKLRKDTRFMLKELTLALEEEFNRVDQGTMDV